MKPTKDINYIKETDTLFEELKGNDLEQFLTKNANEVNQLSCADYLQILMKQKNLKRASVVANCGLEPTYAYHILAGRKNPSRSKILALALSMQLSLDETQHALQYANEGVLYPRNTWDSIIIYAIEHHFSVMDTDMLLEASGETDFLISPK